jgi:hypothetical protein
MSLSIAVPTKVAIEREREIEKGGRWMKTCDVGGGAERLR